MSEVEKSPKTNHLGLTRKDYMGAKSTLCLGCGHDSVTNHIVSAFFQSGVSPLKVAKMSGIGCSSKTPNYFMNQSFGFNSIHGRMAPITTGAQVVHKDLTFIGISGDGDTASIGWGSFTHLVRRNVPMIYIVENNGVYGLTKGQFSATADEGSKSKAGESNPFTTIDVCSQAIDLGASFVARAFSGDTKQMIALIDAGIRHKGTAIIDVISPCTTFANHEGSTKSYNYVKDHQLALQELGFVQPQENISVDYEEGSYEEVHLADGSKILLKKVDSKVHDIKNADEAIFKLRAARQKGEILTGLFYLNSDKDSFTDNLNLIDQPLSQLQQKDLQPESGVLAEIMQDFK